MPFPTFNDPADAHAFHIGKAFLARTALDAISDSYFDEACIALRCSTAGYQATAALLYLKRQLQLEAERHEAAVGDGEDALAASLEEDKGPQGADVRTSIPMIDTAWAVLSRERRVLNAERAEFRQRVREVATDRSWAPSPSPTSASWRSASSWSWRLRYSSAAVA
ncbi:hypothetical protein OIV83_004313 [Microbotryomycetes sp. JL201]|nr:hypothetical protein OIV83_004313 [Microbotryomycetes sp. JL201]